MFIWSCQRKEIRLMPVTTSKNIRSITAKIITELYGNGAPNKAVLASIREAAFFTSPKAQAVWPIMFKYFTPEMLSNSGKPTYSEIAVYAALRFYALSQQGKEELTYAKWSASPDSEGATLFQILAQMRQNPDNKDSLDRRIRPLLKINNIDRVTKDLNQLVGMVKTSNFNQPIDYALLASDLYSFQFNYETANRVRVRWGQQYFSQFNNKIDNLKGSNTND